MAEQFKKIYISPREFINSWEKEIYELNNLDYFVFLLINNLAEHIERSFLNRITADDVLYLHSEEVGTLAFNIGDSLQLFFEKNCFGACKLNCPIKLYDKLEEVEYHERMRSLSEGLFIAIECITKEQCLYSDLLNYVVLDSIIDFYNYEMGIILNESDERILSFSDFCMKIILSVIKEKGQKLLTMPTESAGSLFEDLLQNDNSAWEEYDVNDSNDTDDEDELEPWKTTYKAIEVTIRAFKEDYEQVAADQKIVKYLDTFTNYLTDFLELSRFEEVNAEDLSEFFSIILYNDLALDESVLLGRVLDLFEKLFNYLEFNHEIYLNIFFNSFREKYEGQIARTLDISRESLKKNSYVDILLSEAKDDDGLFEGLFEVVGFSKRGFKLEDIHLKAHYEPVDLSARLATGKLKVGDIVHAQIEQKKNMWYIYQFEMVYPSVARTYLY
ncbi:MAG TPA: hypothetical protein EYP36_12530 [Calditrichaeota bacterium]|nr:hypothetical protein [Calditrichota bacterium]